MALALNREISVLLVKGAIEPVDPLAQPGGFYSTYFLVKKKDGGFRPVLDLRGLNKFLKILSFHMLSTAEVLRAVAREEWFTSVDLKNAYFHVPIVPHHRQFLRFAFQGRHFQFRVLPFRLSLSPRVFTRCVAAALLPLQSQGMKILPYLDDLDLCAIPVSVDPGHGSASLSRGPAGSQGELREELSESLPELDLHRVGSGHSHYEGLSVSSARGRHPPPPSPLPKGQVIALHSFPPPSGQINSCLSCRSLGLTITAPPAKMVEWPPFGRQLAQAQEDPGVTTVPPHPIPMEGEVISGKRRAHGLHSIPQRDSHNGCQPLRVGCSVAEQDSSGSVVCSGLHRAYQRAGATGCTPGSQALPAIFKGDACACPVGQHCDCFSHKPPGGHQIRTVARSVPGATDVGSSSPDQPTGNVPARGAEPGCRFPLPQQTSSRGVAASPRGGAQHLGSLRQGRGGSLCLREVNPLLPLVLPKGEDQPPGAGRSGPHMARGSSVCLSTPPSHLPDTSQSASTGPQAASGGPFLASPDLVSAAAQSPLRDALAPPRQGGPIVSVRGSDLAPRPLPPSAVGLAARGPDPLLSECIEPVRRTILNARAGSTRRQYENRWKLFSDWCMGQNEDPVHCSVPTILEFLQSLLDGGRSPSTLKVYVAAMSVEHARVDNQTVGSHRLVSLFLKGSSEAAPPDRPKGPYMGSAPSVGRPMPASL